MKFYLIELFARFIAILAVMRNHVIDEKIVGYGLWSTLSSKVRCNVNMNCLRYEDEGYISGGGWGGVGGGGGGVGGGGGWGGGGGGGWGGWGGGLCYHNARGCVRTGIQPGGRQDWTYSSQKREHVEPTKPDKSVLIAIVTCCF